MAVQIIINGDLQSNIINKIVLSKCDSLIIVDYDKWKGVTYTGKETFLL